MLIEDYRQGLLQAGFSEVEIIDSAVDLNVYGEVKTRVAIVRPLHSRAIYPSSNWVTARQLKSQTMDCICDWRDCSGVMT